MALDAIVVLGCRVADSGSLGPAATRRAERAAHAFAEGVSTRIIASGGKLWNGFPEAEAFARALVRHGVPRSAISCELWSESTLENARYVAELSRRNGFRSLAVVTCDWHMPRALRAFERQGLHVVPLPAASPPKALACAAARILKEKAQLVLDHLVSLLSERT